MRGVVAAGDQNSAEAAKIILQEGGNAFDAALAAMFAAPLAEPALTSLGGGGFMLCGKKDQEPKLYDFFVDVPPKRINHPQFYPIYVDFKTAVQEFHIGAGSIAIPGVIKGISTIHSKFATMPMQRIIEPAVKYAKEGIKLSTMQAGFVKLLEPIFIATSESQKIYAPNGNLIDDKTPYKNEDYAKFLESFAHEGEGLFYNGEIAQSIEELMLKSDGFIRKEDLQRYKTFERDPIRINFCNSTIYLNPPPSSGGILIAFALSLLKNASFDTFGSMSHLRNIIEAQRISADFRKEQVDSFLHEVGLENILKDKNIMQGYNEGFKSRINLWGNTTHISVIDKEGNFASVTTTNGEGSGHIIPKCGIMLNNMLGEEDLNPHGFFSWPAYVRLPSMMSPTAIYKDKNPFLILGSAGSNRIRSAILQTIINILCYKKSVKEAVELPRIHLENQEVFMEPGFDTDIIEKAKKLYKVHLFQEKNLFFGGVQAVTNYGDGAGDPRRGGVVVVV
ncbi:gamma-glutamyltransferase [Nitrosophilus kaiyonis]|uniref:gamma-glutamyltransferase n=1 Tax=Nitrosophilus kaiyonis TaxID=2930200 RepID=UPI0024915F0C|nr:gamma-glutamyltransferase [Nitrosophilus kaiyonis]